MKSGSSHLPVGFVIASDAEEIFEAGNCIFPLEIICNFTILSTSKKLIKTLQIRGRKSYHFVGEFDLNLIRCFDPATGPAPDIWNIVPPFLKFNKNKF